MTTPPSQPSHEAALSAHQTGRQHRAATVLCGILQRARDGNLPPLAWTVQSTGAGLTGTAEAHPMAARRAEFTAWAEAIGGWAGQGAAFRHERPDSRGVTRLVRQWGRYEGVTLTLVADIYDEEEA